MDHRHRNTCLLRSVTKLATLSLIILITVPVLYSQSILTVAGGGTDDGRLATQAALRLPRGIAVDRFGNLFIADRAESRIRRVDAVNGTLTTVAGNGSDGFSGDGGPAILASIKEPEGVAIDRDGNLFLPGGRWVRRVDAVTGIITTIAGNGDDDVTFSGEGGPATEASLTAQHVSIDDDGNLYITDTSNNRVYRVDALTRIITTVAGNGDLGFAGDGGPATQASLFFPDGTAVDTLGNLYIADGQNHRIRRVDLSTGIITTVAGNGADGYGGDGGPATQASLDFPTDVELDAAGNLYIVDRPDHRIRRVDMSTGVITTIAGDGNRGFRGDGGLATQSRLNDPDELAFDSAGNLYVADGTNRRIRRISMSAGVITTVAGTGQRAFIGDGGPAIQAGLNLADGLAFDSNGNLYISDSANYRIRRVDLANGIISTIAGTGDFGFSGDGGFATDARLALPRGISFDDEDNLYLADYLNHRIRRIDAVTGIITTVAGNGDRGFSGDGGPATEASLELPSDVEVCSSGQIYVADSDSDRIRRIDPDTGIITTVAGSAQTGFSGDGGSANEASLAFPRAVICDVFGNLFIADTSNHRIRRVDVSTGIITTVAGNGEAGFSGDNGPAPLASIDSPSGVAFDAARNLYIGDSTNDRIRRVDGATGIITTIAGNGLRAFTGDAGPARQASLAWPTVLEVDASDNLFIAGYQSGRVRVVPACTEAGAADLLSPANGATGIGRAPVLSWEPVPGAFSYDVLLDVETPPSNLIASDLGGTSFTPQNLEPETTYYWRVVAKGDPFCEPASVTPSVVRAFTTAGGCPPPGAIILSTPSDGSAVSSSSLQLSWAPAAGAARYDLFFGTTSPPPFLTSTSQTSTTVSRLIPGNTYFWSVLARASCNDDQTRRSQESSFTVTGNCEPAQTFTLTEPANGEAGLTTMVTLSWTTSANASSYDLFLDASEPPAVFATALSETAVRVSGLSPGKRHYWRVRANVDCDPSKSTTTPTAAFTTGADCPVPQSTSITFKPLGSVSAGQTYTISWSESGGLDATGHYLVERSLAADFNSILDAQTTSRQSASFVSDSDGIHYHRVRPVMGCDPTVVGAPSATAAVSVISNQPRVIFTVEPRAVIVEPGTTLEDLRTTFALENLGDMPVQVVLSAARIESIPFFTIRDPLGGDSTFVTLDPREPRTFEVRFSGPPAEVTASYQGLIVVSVPGSPVIPYAFVNLKIGADAGAVPQFRVGGTPSEYAFFPGFAGDDADRPPITIEIHNPGSAPMELAAEIGPEVWLEPEPGWNATPIPPGGSRAVRLMTRRTRAMNASALPRYTYFTIRTSSGQPARLLVQDNDALPVAARRTSALPPGVRTLLVPEVLSDITAAGTLMSKIRLTNVGTEPVRTELILTPLGVDGFSTSVERAVVVVPPADVITLTDPLVQLFGLARPARGTLEIVASEDRIGLLRADSSIVNGIRADTAIRNVPVVTRGHGARSGAPHRITGISSQSGQNTSIVLAETSGTDGAEVDLTIFDDSGSERGRHTLTVERYGVRTIDTNTVIGGPNLPTGWIDISVPNGGGTVIGLANIADGTGRAATLLSRSLESGDAGSPGAFSYQPGIRNGVTKTLVAPYVVSGVVDPGGIEWVTTMGFMAPPGSPIEFHVRYTGIDGVSIERTVPVQASALTGQIVEFSNVVRQLFGVNGPAEGSITVTTENRGQVHARLIAGGLPAGSFDLVPTASELTSSGENRRPLYVEGLQQSADASRGARWNLYVKEIGGGAGSVEVRIYEAGNRTHAVAVREFAITAGQQLALETIFDAMGLNTPMRRKDRTNALCVVIPSPGSARIAAVAMEIDNSTGAATSHLLEPASGLAGGVSTSLARAIDPGSPTRRRPVLRPVGD